jgi:hypothetical protein
MPIIAFTPLYVTSVFSGITRHHSTGVYVEEGVRNHGDVVLSHTNWNLLHEKSPS